MKTVSILIFACLGVGLSTPTVQEPANSSISLEITNIQFASGNIHLAIYETKQSFDDSSDPYLLKMYPAPASDKLQVQLDDIPMGRYALALYHDVNNNSDMDKNLFGIPKEPYGFSNNPKAKWSAPKFEELLIEVKDKPLNLSVFLKKWKHR